MEETTENVIELDFDAEEEKDLYQDGYVAKGLYIVPSDWTIRTLINDIESKIIDLNPEFQRRITWKDDRQSKLIESLLLNIPIPQIVLAEDSKGNIIVVDGKQRLFAISKFFSKDDPLKLKGLEILKEYNGYDAAKLQNDFPDVHKQILLKTIRSAVIRNYKSDDYLYLVFHRLNSAGVPLSTQELRQTINSNRDFLNFLNSVTKNNDVLDRLFRKKGPDFRMRDTELVLRYYAFKYFHFDYDGNLKKFLDSSTTKLNDMFMDNQNKSQLINDFQILIEAIVSSFLIFNSPDTTPFGRWSGEKYINKLNRAVFDMFTLYLSNDYTREVLLRDTTLTLEIYKRLCANSKFTLSISSTTKSLEAFYNRFELFATAFKSIDINFPSPVLDSNRVRLFP